MPHQHLTPHQLALLLGDWRSGPGPLYAALTRRLSQLLTDGRVAPGVRLPAERRLAAQLQVSRTTIIRAYDLLREQGLLRSRQGAGSVTCMAPSPPSPFIAWAAAPPGETPPERLIDLTKASPRADPELAGILAEAAAQAPTLLNHHGYDSLGVEALRSAVAERYCRRGLPTTPEQILITAGAQQAIDLVVRSLVRRREPVIIESPTYPGAMDSLRLAGATLVSFDVSREPWRIDELEERMVQSGARLAYLMPDFQNPTGWLMTEDARERLAAICRRHHVTLLVDETLAEIDLGPGSTPPPLAAFDPEDSVLSVGSLSKAVWAGLRAGWVRAKPETIRALARLRATASLGGAPIEQLAAANVFPRLDEFLERLRPELRGQRDVLVERLGGLGWPVERPTGGLSCWARLPGGSSSLLAERAYMRGVVLIPGPRLSPDGQLDGFVRVPFSLPEPLLRDATAILADAYGIAVPA